MPIIGKLTRDVFETRRICLGKLSAIKPFFISQFLKNKQNEKAIKHICRGQKTQPEQKNNFKILLQQK
jgi:hypothetical protein